MGASLPGVRRRVPRLFRRIVLLAIASAWTPYLFGTKHQSHSPEAAVTVANAAHLTAA
jgi:hypothetical protein